MYGNKKAAARVPRANKLAKADLAAGGLPKATNTPDIVEPRRSQRLAAEKTKKIKKKRKKQDRQKSIKPVGQPFI